MDIAYGVSRASTWWDIGAGWWIVMGVCMLFMGVMMFAMMWRGRGFWRGSPGWWWWSGRWPGAHEETPIDVLDRRFAEGEISIEDYRERREALTGGARRGQVAAGQTRATGRAGRD